MTDIRRKMMPEVFQGVHKSAPYFEGWYYKIQLPDGRIYAFIPGVNLSGQDSHSFIQILCSETGMSDYNRYPVGAFAYSPNRLDLQVGDSFFTKQGFEVSTDKVKAQVRFSNSVLFSKNRYSAGIMGPFAFLPFMQCNHAVITVKSDVEGYIQTQNGRLTLEGAYGYIEKDWGSSFPDSYIWTQTSDFEKADASFMLSIAKIPFLGRIFTGIVAFLFLDGKMYRFTTYNASGIRNLRNDGNNLDITVCSPLYELTLSATARDGVLLKAPTAGGMTRDIRENLNSGLTLNLKTHSDKVIFQGTSVHASIEICGNPSDL